MQSPADGWIYLVLVNSCFPPRGFKAYFFHFMRPHTLCTPLRGDWQVAGHLTNTLWWPARENPTTVLLFIPGNPGLVEYYAEFLERIHCQASPNLEIFAGTWLSMGVVDAVYSCG